MIPYAILIISIVLQFAAAFLALKLVWVTKRTVAWILIATAIVLMALRRCFTLYEWLSRGLELLPVDIGTEIIGLATSVSMLLGLYLIAPLFVGITRAKEVLRERVEEQTAQLKNTVRSLELELSQRQEAEEALRASEERFRTVADFTYDWEYWLAPDGSYNYMSPSCERITGYRVDDFMKDQGLLEKITHPDDRELVLNHIREDLSGSKVRSLFFRILTRSGTERWIAHICQPVFDADGRHLGRRISNRDITKYKQAEEEKAKLESQLRQAQKMEAIGTLAGGVAHDFNNILAPIIMYVEVALRSLESDSPIRPYLEQVLKSGMRASDLVKQILAISRQTEQQRIFLQVSGIVKEALKLLRASFPATIEIRQNLVREDDWILADPTEVYQVIMNLVTNAAQAIEDKGVIEVGLDRADLDQEQEGYSTKLKPGSYVRLSVRDSGHGMTPEVLERIFEPYFTTKDVGRGTGLGLAIVHGIVQNYGGGLRVSSQSGAGTTFEVYLPLARMEEEQDLEAPAGMGRGQERILLVDDETEIVAATKIMLEQVGYQVTGFSNSQEALAAFQAAPGSFDVIITDQTMPHLTGVDLAEAILRVRPDIPIIVCTGRSEAATLEKIKSLGLRETILKPILPQTLTEAIRQALGRGRQTPDDPGAVH